MKNEAPKIWFTSDPHYFHRRILELSNRPFANLEQMHEVLIENYNKVVGPGDTVIWVGDCFFGPKVKSKEIMDRLNGKKILVKGNHDQSDTRMIDIGFDFVCHGMTLFIRGHGVELKHYPFNPSGFQLAKQRSIFTKAFWFRLFNPSKIIKYYQRAPVDYGQYLIHGHTHSKVKFRDRQIHVGVDAWNFKPVSISEIESYIDKHSKGKL